MIVDTSPVMKTHPASECFIAYAPRGVGLLCAVVYLAHGNNVCGWWAGRDANAEYPPGFFILENYYTAHGGAFLGTSGGDVRGGWTRDYRHGAQPRIRASALPMEDTLARELEQLQFAFAHEWLVYPEDADAVDQHRRYADAELAVGSTAAGSVAVRFQCLGKFEKSQPVWRHFSRGLDYHVIERLMRCWPLEYRTRLRAD